MEPIQIPDISDKYLNVKEVSELLGISSATVYRLTENRKIPYLRVGGQIRFRKQSLDAWARQREKGALAA